MTISTEERMKILQMVAEKQITPEEAAQLLEALEAASGSGETPAAPPSSAPGRSPRWFRVRVTDTQTGRTRVNVTLPVALVKAGLKMGTRFMPEVEGLDATMLQSLLESGVSGPIVDVTDEEDGEHVEVVLD